MIKYRMEREIEPTTSTFFEFRARRVSWARGTRRTLLSADCAPPSPAWQRAAACTIKTVQSRGCVIHLIQEGWRGGRLWHSEAGKHQMAGRGQTVGPAFSVARVTERRARTPCWPPRPIHAPRPPIHRRSAIWHHRSAHLGSQVCRATRPEQRPAVACHLARAPAVRDVSRIQADAGGWRA